MRSLITGVYNVIRSSSAQPIARQLLCVGSRTSSHQTSALWKNHTASRCSTLLSSAPFSVRNQARLLSSNADKSDTDALLAQIADLIEQRDPKEALRMLNELPEASKNSGDAQYYKGIALASQFANYNEALECLNRARNSDSKLKHNSIVAMAFVQFQIGDYAAAATNFQEYLNHYPNDVSALAQLGECMSSLGRHSEAVEWMRKARNVTPDDWAVNLALSQCYHRCGEEFYRESFQAAVKAWKLNPDEISVLLNMIRNFEDVGLIDEAFGCVKKVLELAPNFDEKKRFLPLLLRLNELDMAEKFISEEFARDKVNTEPSRIHLWISILLARKKYSAARELAEQWTELNPNDPEGWYLRGVSCLNFDVEQAANHFKRVLINNADNIEASEGLATCLYLTGQTDLALQQFTRVPMIVGKNLASVHMFDEANKILDVMLAKFPQLSTSLYHARMTVAVSKRDYTAEFRAYKDMLSKTAGPDSAVYLLLLDGDIEGALKLADTLDMNKVHSVVTKATTLIEANRGREAVELVKPWREKYWHPAVEAAMLTALSLDDTLLDATKAECEKFPSSYDSHFVLSEVYRKLGDYNNAVASWNRAQVIRQSSPTYIFPHPFQYRFVSLRQKARILESMGETQRAINEYNKVLQINPHDKKTQQYLAALQSKLGKATDQ